MGEVAHRAQVRLTQLPYPIARYFSTGDNYATIGAMFKRNKSRVCVAVREVSAAIVLRLYRRFVRWPNDEESQNAIRQNFHAIAGLPRIVGWKSNYRLIH